MIMRIASALAIVLLLVAGCRDSVALPEGWKPEGPIDCRVELSADTVGLMEPVDFTVWAYFEREGRPNPIEPPIPAGFVAEFETDMWRYDKGWIIRRVLHLRPTRLGTITIESMKVRFDGNVTSTPAIPLEVTSVLGSEHDPKAVEDPAALFPAAMPLWPFYVGAFVLLVGILLIVWLRHRSRRSVTLPSEVPLPPHVEALRALERLRQEECRTEEQVEAFYVVVSDILRAYVEARFGLHAPLRSTEEFLVEVEAGDILSLGQSQSLRLFLQQCDLVKFARMFPDVEAHDQTLRIAEDFVQQTRIDVLPEDVSGGEKIVSEKVGGVA